MKGPSLENRSPQNQFIFLTTVVYSDKDITIVYNLTVH